MSSDHEALDPEAPRHQSRSHEANVVEQFGSRAQAYVESPDHASGADLSRIAALVAARSPERVLDVGCGGGHVSFAVAPHARETVAYDLSSQMLAAVADAARTRGLAGIRTQQGRAEALAFADGAFDVVATRFSAHHWRDLPAACAEMRRVLAADGLLLVADTISADDPLADTFLQAIELLRDPSHVRDRSIGEWETVLRDAGFAIGAVSRGRLRLDFAAWTARIGTPPPLAAAIRALQARMPDEIAQRFAVEPDGSFTIDTALIEARPAT